MAEPTLADVLAGMESLREELRAGLTDVRADTQALREELRGELRVRDLEYRGAVAQIRLDVLDARRSVGTLIEAVADLRRDFAEHVHPHRHDPGTGEVA